MVDILEKFDHELCPGVKVYHLQYPGYASLTMGGTLINNIIVGGGGKGHCCYKLCPGVKIIITHGAGGACLKHFT